MFKKSTTKIRKPFQAQACAALSATMPPSAYDTAKRALVTLLLQLGRFYQVALDVQRESPDSVVLAAFRKVARAAHPDKGGRTKERAVELSYESLFSEQLAS